LSLIPVTTLITPPFTPDTSSALVSFQPALVFNQNICADVLPGDAPIKTVRFYYDGEVKFTDKEAPYVWRLDKRSIGKHEIMVTVYDEIGRIARDKLEFFYLNPRTGE